MSSPSVSSSNPTRNTTKPRIDCPGLFLHAYAERTLETGRLLTVSFHGTLSRQGKRTAPKPFHLPSEISCTSFPSKKRAPRTAPGPCGAYRDRRDKSEVMEPGGVSLLFPDTGDGKIENLTAQVIHRVQHRIAPGIKMLLFHAENLHGSAAAQLHGQRIIL